MWGLFCANFFFKKTCAIDMWSVVRAWLMCAWCVPGVCLVCAWCVPSVRPPHAHTTTHTTATCPCCRGCHRSAVAVCPSTLRGMRRQPAPLVPPHPPLPPPLVHTTCAAVMQTPLQSPLLPHEPPRPPAATAAACVDCYRRCCRCNHICLFFSI